MSEPNKEIIRQWFERVWNNRDESAIPELMSADHVGHGFGPNGATVIGPAGFIPFYQVFTSAMPDVRITTAEVISEGDTVCARWSATGTLTGGGLGVNPTGKSMTVCGLSMGRIANGQIVESWNTFDQLDMHQQLDTLKAVSAL
jgi:predicted ester cyclase